MAGREGERERGRDIGEGGGKIGSGWREGEKVVWRREGEGGKVDKERENKGRNGVKQDIQWKQENK